LLIEDNRLLREGVSAMLNEHADMKVVRASGGYEDILHRARTVRAQVILVDVSGFRRVAPLARHAPNFRVIGMGLVPDQSDIVACVRSGASGFILKDATSGEFLSTIRSVAQGAFVLPSTLARSLLSRVVEHAPGRRRGVPPDSVRMTKREREISELIADGLSNKEIALQINVATYTVKSHVHNILEKRGLHSRLEIARDAYKEPRLIRVNEAHPHSLASSSDHTETFPSHHSMVYRPMRTS
jgi:DNA-binding NarL/FixJ family response regulator